MDAAMAQFLITPLGIEEKNVRTIRDACRGNHPWVIFPIQHRPVADLLTRDGRGASQSKWPSLPELLTLWIRSPLPDLRTTTSDHSSYVGSCFSLGS